MTTRVPAQAERQRATPGAGTLPAVWVNGRRHDPAGAHLSALDRGFTLADGLFETMRVYGGVPFRLAQHLARLERGAAALDIPLPAAVREWVLAAVADAGAPELAVRLTVSRGAGGAGLAPPPASACTPTVVVTVSALPAFPSSTYDAGLVGHVATGRRNERSATAGLKTLAYTESVAALLEARRAGADEAILLDTDGHCSEASASNLFAWTGTELLTPPLSCGALPGITREAVLEAARARRVPTEERPFALEELLAAREAFLTSSLREIAPLVRVGASPIGGGAPGPVTREISAAFRALVRGECGA